MSPTTLVMQSLLLASSFIFGQCVGQHEVGSISQKGIVSDVCGSGAKRPNIVLIITDDQDLHMQSLNYMPYVRKHITEKGTSFRRHFCTTALCCPSRVTLLVCFKILTFLPLKLPFTRQSSGSLAIH